MGRWHSTDLPANFSAVGAIPVVRSVPKSSPRSITYGRLRQREVKRLIDNAHHIAGAILAHNQELLKEVAQVLLEREILDGQQLHDYLVGGASPLENRVNTPPLLATWLQTGEISTAKHPLQGINSKVEESISLMSNGFNPNYLHKNLS